MPGLERFLLYLCFVCLRILIVLHEIRIIALTSTPASSEASESPPPLGKTLAERMKEPFQIAHVSRWAHQLAAELVRVHSQGVSLQRAFPLHPSQIRLAADGKSLSIEAREEDPWADEAERFRSCPPEFFSSSSLGKEADIWSFGLIFFELTKGKHPFHDCSDMPTRLQQSAPRMEAPYTLTPPDDLADIVNKCLLRDPSLRFDAKRLQRKVSRIPMDEIALAEATPAPEKESKSQWLSVLAFLIFASAVAGGLVAMNKFKPESEQSKHSKLVARFESGSLKDRGAALETLKARLPKMSKGQKTQFLQTLVFALEEKDPILRRDIAKTIVAIGPEAFELLEAALKDPKLQGGAAQTLREFDVASLPLLTRLFQSKDPTMQIGVMTLIANIGSSKDLYTKDRGAFDARRKLLFDALNHKLPPVRQIAVGAVTAMALKQPKIVPELVKLFNDPRTTSIGGDLLAGLGEKGLPHLMAASHGPNPALRLSASRALVKMARVQRDLRPKVFPVLIEAFLDKDPKVKNFCVSALKGYPQESLPALVNVLPDRKLGMHARQHIVRLGPAKVGNALMKFIADPKAGRQVQGIIRIFSIADEKTRLRLFLALKKGENKEAVINTLVSAGPFILTTINQELFKAQPKPVMLSLLTVLKRLGERAKPSINSLIKLNRETKDKDIREASYDALFVHKLSDAQWISVLVPNAVSNSKALRIKALMKLGEYLGGPQKNPVIQAWTEHIKSSKAPEHLTFMGFLLIHHEESAGKIKSVTELFATMLAKADPGARAYLQSALKKPAQAKGAAAVLKALK